MIVHLWEVKRKQEKHGVWLLVSVFRDNANDVELRSPAQEVLTPAEHLPLREQNGKQCTLRCGVQQAGLEARCHESVSH